MDIGLKYFLHYDYRILATFETLRGARCAFSRKWKKEYPTAVIMTSEQFHATEPMVMVKNLMTGEPVRIKLSAHGGCCDPSTERYWTM